MNIDIEWTTYPELPWRAFPIGQDSSAGRVAVNGLEIFVHALRVHDIGRGNVQTAYGEDFGEEVDAILTAAGGRVQTTDLPGLDGDWIIVAHPYGD